MAKTSLIELLKVYIPTSDEEIQSKKCMLSFIQTYDDCFERSLEIGHITASCWLINKENSKALLTHHAKLNQWFQLGGHCDGNSDVLAVAIKEVQEESGIDQIIPVHTNIFDIDIHLIPANKREKEHYHYDVRFLLRATSDEQIVCSDESHSLRWISKKRSALPTQESSVVRMFNKWIAL